MLINIHDHSSHVYLDHCPSSCVELLATSDRAGILIANVGTEASLSEGRLAYLDSEQNMPAKNGEDLGLCADEKRRRSGWAWIGSDSQACTFGLIEP